MLGHIKTTVQQLLRFMGVLLYHSGLADWVINRSQRTRVTLYHSIENEQGSYTEGLCPSVTPDIFSLHLEYYQRFYQVVSMHDLTKTKSTMSANRDADPKAQLLITFDDGYASVLDIALPMLEAKGMPATTYLIGKAVRGGMVWVNRVNQALNDHDEESRKVLAAYPDLTQLSRLGIIHRIQTEYEPEQINSLVEKLESAIPTLTNETEKVFCTPDDIKQMQRRGMEFGFHTNDHWNLGQCNDSDLAATLTTDGLDELINSKTFAYPFGYFSPAAISRLRRQGYRKIMAVGTNNDRFCELHLDRIEVFEPSFASLFARLEVEEPVMAALQGLVHKLRSQAEQMMGRGEKRVA